MDTVRYLTAREAAAELNVSRATLYAYVSRGLIRSEPSAGPRTRLYRAEDVQALRDRRGAAREPANGAGAALNWGAPVMESAITLIADGALYYRGRDAVALAASASLETVAGILWDCGGTDPFADNPPPRVEVDHTLLGLERCLALLAHAGARDLRALNLASAAVARSGARLVRLLAAGMSGGGAPDRPVHETLARNWGAADRAAPDLIRAALVLVADHELNASTFTVRCVASTRASPYAAVTAGLCALQGPRHGGETARALAMFREIAAAGDPRAGVAERLQRGERIAGCGHPLYPRGDPRAEALLAMLIEELPGNAAVREARALRQVIRDLTGLAPNIDFALATLMRALGLPGHAGFGIFATGRCAGWIAHAQEQYRANVLIRPRSRYVGDPPAGADRRLPG